MIDNITHASEVFNTLNILLDDTLITKGPRPQPIPLAKLVDTTCEQHIDDLATGVKHVILGD